MYCGTCGKELRDGAKFCDECGAIQPAAIPENQKPKTEPEAVAPVEPVIPVAQTPEKPRKKVNKKFLAIIAAVLVVAVTAAIVIPIFFPGKETIYVCVSETHYDADGNKIAYFESEFDEHGNLLCKKYDHETKEITIEDPELGTYTDYTCEFDGKLQTDFIGEYNDDFTYVSWQYPYALGSSLEYEYDDEGRIIEFTMTTEPSLRGNDDVSAISPVTYCCEYDDKGRLEMVYIPDGNSDPKHPDFITQLYEYDKHGRLTTVYWSSKEYTCLNELYYEDGRLSSIEHFGSSTALFQSGDNSGFYPVHTFTYEYDKKGNLIEIVKTDGNGEEIYVEEHEYSEEGLLEEIITSYPNNNSFTKEYTCDEYGNILEIKNPDGRRVEYEYEALKVSKQEALYYHRRYQNSNQLYGDVGQNYWITATYIPDPLEENK